MEVKKLNEYEEYSVRLCKDIEQALNYIEELEDFALFVGKTISSKK